MPAARVALPGGEELSGSCDQECRDGEPGREKEAGSPELNNEVRRSVRKKGDDLVFGSGALKACFGVTSSLVVVVVGSLHAAVATCIKSAPICHLDSGAHLPE